MKQIRVAAGALLMLAVAAGASAQVYKWVDAKGVTHYSDQPPADGPTVELKDMNGAGGTGGGSVPYEVALAMRTAPVTLYTTTGCQACDQARTLLQTRGVPYSEKSVSSNDDIAALRAAGGQGDVPFILIGSMRLTGFSEQAMNDALTAAGYPAKRMLGANFKFAQAAPAGGPKAPSHEAQAKAAAEEAARARADEEKRKKLLAKPNFQF